MGTKAFIRLALGMALLFSISSCTTFSLGPVMSIEESNDFDNRIKTSLTFYVDGEKYQRSQDRTIQWSMAPNDADYCLLLKTNAVQSKQKDDQLYSIGYDKDGTELFLGPAIWLCFPNNLSIGTEQYLDNTDNAIVITRKVTIKKDYADYYSYYPCYKVVPFSTLSITYKKINGYVIECGFYAEVYLDFLAEPRMLKLENGEVLLGQETKNSTNPFTYDSWTAGRDQFSYWP